MEPSSSILLSNSKYAQFLCTEHDQRLLREPLRPDAVQVGLLVVVSASGPTSEACKAQWLAPPNQFVQKSGRRRAARPGEREQAYRVDGRRCYIFISRYYHRHRPWVLNFLQLRQEDGIGQADDTATDTTASDAAADELELRSAYGSGFWTEDGYYRHAALHVTLRRSRRLRRSLATGEQPQPIPLKGPIEPDVFRGFCLRFVRWCPAGTSASQILERILHRLPYCSLAAGYTGEKTDDIFAEAQAIGGTEAFARSLSANRAQGLGLLSPRVLLEAALSAKLVKNPVCRRGAVPLDTWSRREYEGELFHYVAVASFEAGQMACNSLRRDNFVYLYSGMEAGGVIQSLKVPHYCSGEHDLGPGVYGGLASEVALYFMYEHWDATLQGIDHTSEFADTTGCVLVHQLPEAAVRQLRCHHIASAPPGSNAAIPAKLNWDQLRTNEGKFVKFCQLEKRRPDVVGKRDTTEFQLFCGPLCTDTTAVRSCRPPAFHSALQLCFADPHILRKYATERWVIEFHYPSDPSTADGFARLCESVKTDWAKAGDQLTNFRSAAFEAGLVRRVLHSA